MKPNAHLIIGMALLASPVAFADQTCRDDAANTGYLGVVELLPACEPSLPARQPERLPEKVVKPTEAKPNARAVAEATVPTAR